MEFLEEQNREGATVNSILSLSEGPIRRYFKESTFRGFIQNVKVSFIQRFQCTIVYSEVLVYN